MVSTIFILSIPVKSDPSPTNFAPVIVPEVVEMFPEAVMFPVEFNNFPSTFPLVVEMFPVAVNAFPETVPLVVEMFPEVVEMFPEVAEMFPDPIFKSPVIVADVPANEREEVG